MDMEWINILSWNYGISQLVSRLFGRKKKNLVYTACTCVQLMVENYMELNGQMLEGHGGMHNNVQSLGALHSLCLRICRIVTANEHNYADRVWRSWNIKVITHICTQALYFSAPKEPEYKARGSPHWSGTWIVQLFNVAGRHSWLISAVHHISGTYHFIDIQGNKVQPLFNN